MGGKKVILFAPGQPLTILSEAPLQDGLNDMIINLRPPLSTEPALGGAHRPAESPWVCPVELRKSACLPWFQFFPDF